MPPRGLGADVPLLKRICAEDIEALALIDKEIQNPEGKPATGSIRTSKTGGTTRDQALRKLRTEADKDDADETVRALYRSVLAGQKSPHRAMVEAGFRPKTCTIRTDDPDKVAAVLARHFDARDIEQICSLALAIREGLEPGAG
jgi:hypothetical protein